MADRFDLEQDILKCWGVVDDLKFYIKHADDWLEDERMNYLSGIAVKYDKKFDQMFKVFEDIVHQGGLGPWVHPSVVNPAPKSDNLRDAYDHEAYLDSLNDG